MPTDSADTISWTALVRELEEYAPEREEYSDADLEALYEELNS